MKATMLWIWIPGTNLLRQIGSEERYPTALIPNFKSLDSIPSVHQESEQDI